VSFPVSLRYLVTFVPAVSCLTYISLNFSHHRRFEMPLNSLMLTPSSQNKLRPLVESQAYAAS